MGRDAAIVLAAGQGTRMRSNLPKVLHPLAGKSMLSRIIEDLETTGFQKPVVVVGYGADEIMDAMGDRCRCVLQREQRGTGDAARVGLEALPRSVERVLLIHGDEPLLSPEIFRRVLGVQEASGADCVLLGTETEDTRAFGRIIRNERGSPVALIQDAELSADQRTSREAHLGLYVFTTRFLRELIPLLAPHPPKGELYLTDAIEMAAGKPESYKLEAVTIEGGTHLMGINDLVHLEQATRYLYARKNRSLMENGVTITDSPSTFIDDEVEIEPDTVIYPFSMVSGHSRIGRACVIGPNARIASSRIGRRCRVEASTVEHAEVGDHVLIGPYSHLRPGAQVGARCEIGNYAEIKQSTIGAGTRVHHFSYVGDAQIGRDVNIGAGTITMNYDGVAKHQTTIEDGAFIGSDTLLRAPVRVGRGAATGAGAVVTRDVPAGKLAVGMPARSIRDVKKGQTAEPEGEMEEGEADDRHENL